MGELLKDSIVPVTQEIIARELSAWFDRQFQKQNVLADTPEKAKRYGVKLGDNVFVDASKTP